MPGRARLETVGMTKRVGCAWGCLHQIAFIGKVDTKMILCMVYSSAQELGSLLVVRYSVESRTL